VLKSNEEIVAMYRRISRRIHDDSLMNRLGAFFHKRQTLQELLEWTHSRVRFNKGSIERHEDPMAIIEYGQGKCREFSILFTALCLANSYKARLILDLSDHAWTEVWSDESGKWVHVDPSEKRMNDPEMYERDWNKDLKEVYAFENGVLEDVTTSYKRSKRN
jgi:transglutaminase-like putative cysteine protease